MKPSGQMTVSLTGELEQFVRDQVRTGAFASGSISAIWFASATISSVIALKS